MNPNIVKPEKFDHLLLVYHFTVTLIRKTWDDRFAGKVGGGGDFEKQGDPSNGEMHLYGLWSMAWYGILCLSKICIFWGMQIS